LVGRTTVQSLVTAIKKGLKSLDVKTDPELDSTNGENKKIIINALTNNWVIFQLLIITL
jgi:hypothetical protein